MDTAGIDDMRVLRSSRLLPVVAIAGAVLALALVLAFVTVNDLVGFRLWPADPPPAPAQTLVVRDQAPVAAALPRRSAPAPAEGSRGVARRAGPAPPSRTGPAGDGSPPPRNPQAATEPLPGVAQPPLAPPRSPPVLPEPPPAPPPAPVPRSRPLRPVGDLISATTTGVASALRATTGALGGRTEPVSPALGTTVSELGDVLAHAVQGRGQALGDLLGSPPGNGPASSSSAG
jgi:hypothetical protein